MKRRLSKGVTMTFQDMDINPSIIKAIDHKGYVNPTPVQEKAIPTIISGRDVLGCAQTGTGKTAAFAIPILQMAANYVNNSIPNNKIKALVLAPTRELAIQIGESFESYGKFLDVRIGVVFGGITPKRHIKVLKKEPHILVATPGRLLDLIGKGYADLSEVSIFVLDEADQMLDARTRDNVKEIIKLLPDKRQNTLFSATMPKEVIKLTNTILENPIKIDIKSSNNRGADIHQIVMYVEEPDKTSMLLKLLKANDYESVLIFVRTKKKADKVCKAINIQNIRTKAIHGDKSQSERLKALELFKNKEIKILVATDVAARGIDIFNISLVVNMDIPRVSETFVHRIGRTGRAGKSGMAISFCSKEEKDALGKIEQILGKTINVMNADSI